MEESPVLAILLMTLLSFQLIPASVCLTKHVPSDSSQLEAWIHRNMKEFLERKSELSHGRNQSIVVDQRLATAEDCFKVITVKKDGSGDFRTVTDAVNSIPPHNKQRVVVKICGGEYWEKITIDSSKKFITLYGDPNDMPKIVCNGTAFEYGTIYSATVAVESDYFVAVNIVFMVRSLNLRLFLLLFKNLSGPAILTVLMD